MSLTKNGHKRIRVAALAVMSLAFSLTASHAPAATTLYYNANGTGSGYGTSANGTTSWDGNVWSTTSSSTAASSTWVAGDVGEFLATSATYTVSVGVDESTAGLDSGTTTTAETTIISQTASTSGDLDLVSGADSFTIADASSVIEVKAPMIGPGEVVQHGGGTLELLGNNSYSGGTEVTGGQLTYYNNSNSFGTNNIIIGGGLSNAFLSAAAGTVTIPNNWTFNVTYPLNLVGGNGTITAPGTIYSGNFALAAAATQNFETSNTATNVDEISGIISGSGTNVEFSDRGVIILAAANSYNGTTLVTSSVNAPVTLVLAAAGAIASSSQVIMQGGILNPDGINQIMSNTTMQLSTAANSTSSIIDFGVGAAEIDFANSSAVAWTAGTVLDLMNWTPGVDALRFGTDDTGLISTQLAEIEINGDPTTLGEATLDANGYVVVPEPASLSMLGLGALGLLARRRK